LFNITGNGQPELSAGFFSAGQPIAYVFGGEPAR